MWIKAFLTMWSCLPAVCPRNTGWKNQLRNISWPSIKSLEAGEDKGALSPCVSTSCCSHCISNWFLEVPLRKLAWACLKESSERGMHCCYGLTVMCPSKPSHLRSHSISPWHQELVIALPWPAASSSTFIMKLSFKHRVTFKGEVPLTP